MTKTNIVLATSAVVFGAGCFVLFKEGGTQRSRVRALEAQVADLQREMMTIASASQSVTSDTTSTSEPSAQAAALQMSQPSAPTVAKPVTATNSEWRAVLADPAYRRARLAEARLQLQRGYPQLVAELGLSADEAERFLDLLSEQSLRENERAMKKQSGQDPMQWRRELYAQAEKERRAFLGEERFATWTAYVNSTSARGFVNDLRTQLATTTSPLHEEQVKPLVKALATEHERHAVERRENYNAETSSGGQWTDATPSAERIEYMERRAALIEASLDRQQEAGQVYLDSVQQREFNALLDRQREQARVELESFRAQVEAAERNQLRSR
jgi:polyhydroxyalkanoate synthesis regulator phasin